MSIFGPEFEQIWPKAGSALKLTEFGKRLLKQCESIKKPENADVDIEAFMKKSSEFPLEFGSNNCRVMSQPKDRYPNIKKQISSAYPVIHERVLQLYLDFLEYKCLYGHPLEQTLYRSLGLSDFVQRLLDKRCVAFVGDRDSYLLMTGQRGVGYSDYPHIGTPHEKEPLTLNSCISYSEIKLSAFLSISSSTELLNDGNRHNEGEFEKDLSKIERQGIVMGLIGARFERPHYMEYEDIIISSQQNTKENGYGHIDDDPSYTSQESSKANVEYRKLWQKFYQEKDLLYDPALADGSSRFYQCPSKEIFDNVLMKKRYAITFDTLLLEAQSRAEKCQRQAYIHIVGIGLGVWKKVAHQNKIFLETFSQRVQHLLPKLNNIGALHFSWFHMDEWHDLKHNGFIESATHPLGGIHVFMSNRNPADKLNGQFENMMLVISYAWDGNALPGNEFWFGSLSGSNDPSTACSTLISELHNPHINTKWICGDNLHIASGERGAILHIRDYVEKISQHLL
uniref:Uncharacterized protein n=1 Tax=Musca domestica TaxID=7370 RepID=A0A1I8NIN0_MUSDO